MYDPKFASAEAIVITPDFSYNLDYCKFIDIFTPLKCFYFDPFQCVNCSEINVKKFNPESFNLENIVKVNCCYINTSKGETQEHLYKKRIKIQKHSLD